MLATSEPELGSVMAKKPKVSALTQAGMKRFFCSSVPNLLTVTAGPMFCMLKGRRHEPLTLAICSARITDSKKAETVAAVLFGQRAAEEAELRHLLDQFGAELVVFLVLLEGGEDFLLGEILRHLLHHPLLIRQSELHF